MVKKKPASPHTAIEVKNATLAWESSHASAQSSPKMTPKMKKDKMAKSRKGKRKLQQQQEKQQAMLAEQKGHLLVDSDDPPSPEEENRQAPPTNVRLQRTLYGVSLDIEKVRRQDFFLGGGIKNSLKR